MEPITDGLKRIMNDRQAQSLPKPSGTPSLPTPTASQAPSEATCQRCGGSQWVYATSKCIPNDKERLVRCPDCTDWLAVSRLTVEEQHHTIDDINDRKDDQRGEMMALRFLGKQMLDDPY